MATELGDKLKEALGRRLQQIWRDAGYTKDKDIANILEKSHGYISQTFTGHRTPSWDFIIATCEHCHKQLGEVFYDIPEGDRFIDMMMGLSVEERIMVKNFIRFLRKKEHLSPAQKLVIRIAK